MSKTVALYVRLTELCLTEFRTSRRAQRPVGCDAHVQLSAKPNQFVLLQQYMQLNLKIQILLNAPT